MEWKLWSKQWRVLTLQTEIQAIPQKSGLDPLKLYSIKVIRKIVGHMDQNWNGVKDLIDWFDKLQEKVLEMNEAQITEKNIFIVKLRNHQCARQSRGRQASTQNSGTDDLPLSMIHSQTSRWREATEQSGVEVEDVGIFPDSCVFVLRCLIHICLPPCLALSASSVRTGFQSQHIKTFHSRKIHRP